MSILKRSYVYEALPTSIENLKAVKTHQDNILLKSDDFNSFREYTDDHLAQREICKSITEQFDALNKDFAYGRVNLVKYRETLKPLKEFLDANPDFKCQEFPRREMETLMRKFL